MSSVSCGRCTCVTSSSSIKLPIQGYHNLGFSSRQPPLPGGKAKKSSVAEQMRGDVIPHTPTYCNAETCVVTQPITSFIGIKSGDREPAMVSRSVIARTMSANAAAIVIDEATLSIALPPGRPVRSHQSETYNVALTHTVSSNLTLGCGGTATTFRQTPPINAKRNDQAAQAVTKQEIGARPWHRRMSGDFRASLLGITTWGGGRNARANQNIEFTTATT